MCLIVCFEIAEAIQQTYSNNESNVLRNVSVSLL